MTTEDFAKKVKSLLGEDITTLAGQGELTRAKAAVLLCHIMCLGPKEELCQACKDHADIEKDQQGAVGTALYYSYLTCDDAGNFNPKALLTDADCERMMRLANPGRLGVRSFLKTPCHLETPLAIVQRVYRVQNEADIPECVRYDAENDTRICQSYGAAGQKHVYVSKIDPCRYSTIIYGDNDAIDTFLKDAPAPCPDKAVLEETNTDYQMISYLADHEILRAKQLNTTQFLVAPAVEELRFELSDVSLVDKWMQCDHDFWSEVLSRNEGFHGKEIWQSKQNPCLLKTVIYWRTREDWYNFDHDLLAPVDAQMDKAMGEGNCRFYDAEHDINEYYLHYTTV